MSVAAGLNSDRHWEPYLWIGVGVVVLIVAVVLLLHRHRQRSADRDMGSTFTAAGFSSLMDNLSWYGQGADRVTGEQPIQRPPDLAPGVQPTYPSQAQLGQQPDLGYRAGLQAAGNQAGGQNGAFPQPAPPYQPYPNQPYPTQPGQPHPNQPPPGPWVDPSYPPPG